MRVRIEKDVITRVHRFLKGEGKYFVSLGQEVTPEEIIGTSEIPSGFTTLNLANLLDVSAGSIGKYLKKQPGARIYKDELLAYRSGWFFNKPKVVICPTDGILDLINDKTGKVRITRFPQKMDLPAGVYGVIEDIDEDQGKITIKTQVSKVLGLFGSGKMRDGILHVLTERDGLMRNSIISAEFDGAILVNGSLILKDTISTAISCGVSGIITGGINAAEYKSVVDGRIVFPKKLENDIGVSIMVCEGFGSLPLGEDIYEILSSYRGRFVQLDGNHAVLDLPSFESSCMTAIRKTKLPPKSSVARYDTQLLELKIGQRVRIVGSSFASEQGKIITIDKSKTKLASGIYAHLLTLETKRRKIQVPSSNVEIISP